MKVARRARLRRQFYPAMDLAEKVSSLPAEPGVYLFKDALGNILYVGESGSLRNRVKSYFLESNWANAKTGSLVREIVDLEFIVVDNEREALALENLLIKQHKPKFNVLLRDDKTYPYIRFTAFEKFPRVYVTRRLVKDGSIYLAPTSRTASRTASSISFTSVSASPPAPWISTRAHPRPCLQYYIHRCHGPCVPGLVADERYAEAARDTRLFLEGRRHDLIQSLEQRMEEPRAKNATSKPRAIAIFCKPSKRSRRSRKSSPAPATTPTPSPGTRSRRKSP